MTTDPEIPTCLRCEEDEFDCAPEITFDAITSLAYAASEGVEPDRLIEWCRDQQESIDPDDLRETIAWLVALQSQMELQPAPALRRKG